LQRQNVDCQIFEKEAEVGGLCRSKKIDGFTFDYDGHLMHFKQAYVFDLMKSLLGSNLVEHRRSAWIYSYGTYSRYPFQANLYGLPLPVIKECLLGFIRATKNGKPHEGKNFNFSSWINHTFGKGIAKNFMIPYNKKFWTLSPQELTCDWLDGFIPVPSLSEIVDGTIEESKRQFGYSARFWYPKRGGICEISQGLASSIKNIYTNSPIAQIDIHKKEIKMASGNKERFDLLISTIPLPEMAYLVKGLPNKIRALFKELRWNSILNLNLGLERKDCFGRHWIYFPQKEFCFFRVGFYNNFSTYLTPQGKSSLYVEVSYSKHRPLDKSNIVSKIVKDLNKAGILHAQDKISRQDVNDIKYGYPIYDKNYRKTREEILEYLSQNSIIPCGRYGSWRYMSMEDVIAEGKGVADTIADAV